MSILQASARVELRTLWRGGSIAILAVLSVVLILAAALATGVRQANTVRLQVTAEESDRAVFLSQGERNPHTVAHFSRYAVRPADSLSKLDPGVNDHQGAAVWMEAHKQDPANFRAAEDQVALPWGVELSPGWLFTTLVPLVAMLAGHGALAALRERRTLELELIIAGNARSLVLGRLAGHALLVLVPTMLVAASLATWAAAGSSFPDSLARMALWVAAVGIYVSVFIVTGLAVSAFSGSVRGALAAVIAVWVISVAVVPRVASSLAEAVAPLPKGQGFAVAMREAVTEAVEADRHATGIGEPEGPKTVVVDGKELSARGVALARGELAGNTVQEAANAELAAAQDKQERIRLMLAGLSPASTFRSLSALLAGADLAHQRDFTRQAEDTRRSIVTLLNGDLAAHAGERADYVNDATLWRQVPEFAYVAPPLAGVTEKAWPKLLVLGAWAVLAGLLLFGATRNMERPR